MSLYPVDRGAFDAAAQNAEAARQSSMIGITDQNVANKITCQYFVTVIGAGTLFNVATLAEQTAFNSLGCSRMGLTPQISQNLFTLDQSKLGGPDVLGP